MSGNAPHASGEGAPQSTPIRIWVLTSGRAGDDQQSRRLAAGLEATLGAHVEERAVVFRSDVGIADAVRGPSLEVLDRDASARLEAPWPDLVISAGWRQVPVVRWIREASDGRTRLVQFNRPPCIEHFDLVFAAPQYGIPTRANVVPLDLPLQEPGDPAERARVAQRWEPRLASLPKPWTILLVGGSTWPLRLDPEVARNTFETALARARSAGGSLLLTTSRRTPDASAQALRDAANAAGEGDCFLFEWDPEAADNPYLAFLELGDEFVVTEDSISMLVEVVRLGRPLAVVSLPRRTSLRKAAVAGLKRALHGRPDSTPGPLRRRLSDWASDRGLKFERDLSRVSDRFVEQGWASRFPSPPLARTGDVPNELERAIERVRSLLSSTSRL